MRRPYVAFNNNADHFPTLYLASINEIYLLRQNRMIMQYAVHMFLIPLVFVQCHEILNPNNRYNQQFTKLVGPLNFL